MDKYLSEFNLDSYKISQFKKYYDYLIEENKKINLTTITDEKEAYIKHFYVRDLIGQFLSKKCKQDAMHGDKVVMKRKISLMSETENNWLYNDLIEISNYSIENLKGKNVLITHEDVLPFLLKLGYKITFCGDLKNNNKWINIANFNKCEYKWIKSEFFDQMYKKEDFDFVY